MKARHFLLLASIATLLPACDRKPQIDPEEVLQKSKAEVEAVKQQLADLQERERQREQAAAAAKLEQDRQALAAERASLEAERAQLSDEQRRVADARLAQIREQERAAAKREAEQKSAQQQQMEQQRAAERAAAAAREAEARAAAQAAQQQQQARSEQTLDFFFDALDPHGEWVEVERYGYCFQPAVARQSGWRPYLDGHWVFTNYGWTWVSQEAFGWATYHYGRWTRLRGLGWVWVPGSEWAPAWVSWRRSDRYVGWAPLPPEAYSGSGFNAAVDSYYDIGPASYNFVGVDDLGGPTYVGRVLERERNVVVINETRNVTNTDYRRIGDRSVLFNEGPDFDEIERHSRVRRLELERMPQGRPEMAQERGGVLQLLAPFIAAAARPKGEPSRVRERVNAPEVERGWTGQAPAQVARIRAEQQAEARRVEQVQRVAARGEAPRPPVAGPAATPRPPLPPQRLATPPPVAEKPAPSPDTAPVRAPKATPKAAPRTTTPATPVPAAEEKPARPPKGSSPPAAVTATPAPKPIPTPVPARQPKATPAAPPTLPPAEPAAPPTLPPAEPAAPPTLPPAEPAATTTPPPARPKRPATGDPVSGLPDRPEPAQPKVLKPPQRGPDRLPKAPVPEAARPLQPVGGAPTREGAPALPAEKPPRARPKGAPKPGPEAATPKPEAAPR